MKKDMQMRRLGLQFIKIVYILECQILIVFHGQEKGTHWIPTETDVSIRPGWYYHKIAFKTC